MQGWRQGVIIPLATALTAACSDFSGPDRGDPAQYALADVSYGICGWYPEQPPPQLALFDVMWRDEEPEQLRPTEAQRQAILDANGTIVHEFNFAAIRAILPVDSLPALDPNRARSVADPDDYTVEVFVIYDRPVSEADSIRVIQLGATRVRMLRIIDGLIAVVSDDLVPRLRRESGVRWVSNGETIGACIP